MTWINLISWLLAVFVGFCTGGLLRDIFDDIFDDWKRQGGKRE